MSKTKTRFRPDSERLRATLSGGVGLCLAVALCALAACGGLADAADGNGEQTCEKMKEIGMLECLNGGHLYSARNTSRLSCSRCECPDEEKWTGIDCSLCRSKDHCPVGPGGKEATGCTFGGNVEPTVEELEQPRGKILSCSCGGDPQSEQYCKMQPNTFAMISMKKAGNDGNLFERDSLGLASAADLPEFEMQITEFAGSPDPVPGKPRYKYAFPVVWNATLTSCKHSVGPCYGPLKAPECDLIQCGGALVRCPPPGVPKCPGWDPVGDCGPVPNDPNHTNYWQFHCIPMSIPVNSSGTLYCERGGGGNGTLGESRCYFYQAKSLFGQGIAIKCQTGNCVYNSTSPTPDPKPGPHGGSYHVPALIATNVLFALVLGVFIFSAGFFVFKETQKWQLEEGFVMLPGAERRVPLEFRDVFADGGGQEFYLEWKVESYCVPMQHLEKRILRNVSGFVCAAKPDSSSEGMVTNVFAILGPSGAGKTTLLDILAGRNTTGSVTGDIRVNGKPVTPATMTQIAGYAPQSDILPGTSTVWEYLLFHANLRLPPTTTPTETKVRVRDIVLQLGLMKVVDSFIGDEYTRGISGGEKKRVSVASELLHRPSILFLDEPTTGLDSTNAATMVEALASLAEKGINVILSIQQPRSDIFRLMERVLVLSSDGEMMYSGPARMLLGFLGGIPGLPAKKEKENTADYILDVIIKSGDYALQTIITAYQNSAAVEEENRLLNTIYVNSSSTRVAKAEKSTVGYGKQVKELSKRLLKNTMRQPFLVYLNFVSTCLVALMLGLVFFKTSVDFGGIQNRMGSMFFIVLYLGLASLSSVPVWNENRLLFLRERASGAYSTFAYFTSMVLFDILPMRIIPTCMFSLSYFMIGLSSTTDAILHFPTFLVILILANAASVSMSMCIGACFPDTKVANAFASLAVLVSIMYSGFILSRHTMGGFAKAGTDFSYMNFAFEALLINEFHGAKGYYFNSYADSRLRVNVTGDEVLDLFDFNANNLLLDISALFMIGFFFFTMCFLLLLRDR